MPPRDDHIPPPPDAPGLGAGAPGAGADVPKLLVDWGMPPRVGHQARPRFVLVCPPAYHSRPAIHLEVDRALDDHTDGRGFDPRSPEEGLWEFHAVFGLTTNDADCRPGQYLLVLRVAFEHEAADLPRYFECTIRLLVGDTGAERTLEIDGDGQSIVNLHGHDLRSFGRVVLRGGDAAVLNLQGTGRTSPMAPIEPDPPENLTHEYVLKIDRDREARAPRIVRTAARERLESAVLAFDDGRRVALLPGARTTLGRGRSNDVVLRFLPRGRTNDTRSKNLSRTHLVTELVDGGLQLRDESTTGLLVQGDPLEGELVIPFDGPDAVDLRLGITRMLDVEPLQLRMQLIGEEGGPLDSADRDEEYVAATGERMSRLWRRARTTGIDAVRIQRVNNRPEWESILLYRVATIGSSVDRCAIVIPSGRAIAARILHVGRTFWLENLGDPHLTIDGNPLPPLRLHPLSLGTSLRITGATCTIEPGPLGLDDATADE